MQAGSSFPVILMVVESLIHFFIFTHVTGLSDPHVTIKGPTVKKKWKTSVKFKTLDPVWDEIYQGYD